MSNTLDDEDDLLEIKKPVDEQGNMEVTKAAEKFLLSASTWGLFLSIVGFFMVGILLLVGLHFASRVNPLRGGSPNTSMLIVVVFAVLYFFPNYYLFVFSQKIKQAILSKDSRVAAKAFENLKAMFAFTGVIALVGIAIYIVFFVLFSGRVGSGF